MGLPLVRRRAGAAEKIQHPEAGEAMIFTSAGIIGLMGVSQRGVGICVNTLSQLAERPTGLPVAFAMRGALLAAKRLRVP
jgi:hypothetical protein